MATSDPAHCPFEHRSGNEAKQISETTDITVKLLDKRYTAKHEKILRAVHPKSHGCVQATFTINAAIDETLKVGLFAHPGRSYRSTIRFSNAAALIKPDIDANGDHGSRGMAIKVYDVEGEILLDDNGAKNQDFLMINQPVFAFANSEDYLRLNRIILKHNDDPEGFFAPLKLQDPNLTEAEEQRIMGYIAAENISGEAIQRILDTFKIVQQIKSTGIANPLETQYFSAAPFLFGPDRVMKFSAKPCLDSGRVIIPENPGDDYLHDALLESLSQNQAICFDFMLQVRSEDDDLGIENASTLWDERRFPFVKVAKISIPAPQTDLDSAAHLQHCEDLALTPWHALAAHRPIGSINRLRKPVYKASAEHRLGLDEKSDLPWVLQLLEKLFKLLFGR